jgi:hypothetical protein
MNFVALRMLTGDRGPGKVTERVKNERCNRTIVNEENVSPSE